MKRNLDHIFMHEKEIKIHVGKMDKDDEAYLKINLGYFIFNLQKLLDEEYHNSFRLFTSISVEEDAISLIPVMVKDIVVTDEQILNKLVEFLDKIYVDIEEIEMERYLEAWTPTNEDYIQ